MNFSDKNVLFFDLDGTLVDSAPDLAHSVNQTLITLGVTPFSESIIRNWVGNGAKTLIQRALSGNNNISVDLDDKLTERALSIFFKVYESHLCIKSQLYNGVFQTLTELKLRGYELVIITNKPEQFIQPILDGLSLNNLFKLVIGGDTLIKRKPDPLPLNFACQQCAVNTTQCLMIGDSKNDILAAKAAKIESIAVTYGYNYGENINNYDPDLVLNNFSELLNVLH